MTDRFWIITGGIFCGLSVALGALAAHGLESHFNELYGTLPPKKVATQEIAASAKYLNDFKTAAEYQMYHGLGLIAVGVLSARKQSRTFNIAGLCFLFGTLLFSGCLYVLALTATFWLGAIVPIGGVLFLVGWGFFCWGALGHNPRLETAPA